MLAAGSRHQMDPAPPAPGMKYPDYFSCHSCAVARFGGEKCDEFQQAGRCRAAMLGTGLAAGSIRIELQLRRL